MTSEQNENNWKALRDMAGRVLYRGALIAFDTTPSFEKKLVLMLCENSDRQMSLICITGYKAGIDPYVNIPAEACVREDGLGISASWLWDNFEHWIFPDVDKEIILVKEHPLEVEEIYA